MRKYSFAEIIGQSWKRMTLILFKPYSLKKWIFFLIIITMAGHFGGFTFNFSPRKKGKEEIKITIKPGAQEAKPSAAREAAQAPPAQNQLQVAKEAFGILKKDRNFVTFAILAFIVFFMSILLWLFIRSVFQFVFIEDIIKNDASARMPFHKNRALGHSYLLWTLVFAFFVIAAIIALVGFPAYSEIKSLIASGFSSVNTAVLLAAVSRYIILFILFFAIVAVIDMFACDFVTVLMYNRQIGVKMAWQESFRLFGANMGSLLLYLLVKLGLGIVSIITFIVLGLAAILVSLLAIGGLALLGSFILTIIPAAAKTVANIALFIMAIPVYCFIFLTAASILIPIPVFFRLFSMFFLGSIDEGVDALLKQESFMTTEEDIKRYNRPLFPVWWAFILPLIFIALVVLAAFAGKTALAKENFQQKITSSAIPLTEDEKADFSIKEILRKPDIIYLKNKRMLEGKILREDSEAVTVSMEGGTVTLSKKDIEYIKRGD